jgi:hypothetical protein
MVIIIEILELFRKNASESLIVIVLMNVNILKIIMFNLFYKFRVVLYTKFKINLNDL